MIPSGSTPEEIVEKIRALSPPDQLRLAAELLERKRPVLALSIISLLNAELQLLRARGKL